ncbi:MAG: NAD-dependent epimerase/dehydratase family protein [Nostoc sp. ZfuVER08]|jgi:nucleoside-diphosphate-sugar epimerase|uniref:NAD-dependent epimerase/dehydratase n=1 Tax=Nostoc punctiforme FACHB-252 TaxID=1357509 RepID=A0ABR8HG71_NOSPU|nr:SDR family oxidoreductase [Nostoc punctiforme]MBD2614805.1 NAD-dependent epimerase/dehydratase [Nostoc punctiforme FACHB-252]MBL1199075.1 NAD-dependent epimerase/dehydratase [Nostoc sp. GBBB01]MDZ8012135.1 NAD-dependent epimerase/dehydratase [Nostoc sp. ZfuVER08]
MSSIKQVLVTGGAGYVGAILVPKLLQAGYAVKVLDLYLYGKDVLAAVKDHPNLEEIEGDIRDRQLLEKIMPGCDAVIHLACISNDPSFELDPDLGRSINYDAFFDLVDVAKDSGVKRFIYASSASVYGIKETENVTEELPLMPLTDYSRYKALCEEVLLSKREPGFVTFIVRPASICGYSPRQRLDLVVNIFTNQAINNGKITVFGGDNKRPSLHIQDMAQLYLNSLQWPDEAIDGKVFNVGYENYTVTEIAEMTREVVGESVQIVTTPTNDTRSYHISSEKIKQELGFVPSHTVENAIQDLASAFKANQLPNSLTDSRYYNVKVMKEINFK